MASAELGRSRVLIVFKSIAVFPTRFYGEAMEADPRDPALSLGCLHERAGSRRKLQSQRNSNSVLGPAPGVMSVGHCLEPNGTSGGRNGVMPSLADSATMASRALLPISS